MLKVSGHTRVAAVIGDPVAHSLSPAIHNAAFAATDLDWTFVALRVERAGLEAAIAGARAFALDGLSVTMPHKAAVLPLLDEVHPDAAALDAVNCVVRDGGRLIGENTDGPGFLDALAARGVEVADQRVLVLGAGGAGRSVIRSLARAGVAEIGVANRSVERQATAVELGGPIARPAAAAEAADFDIVVNATSVGMGVAAAARELPIDAGLLHPRQVVVDLVYEPVETGLLAAARTVGAVAIDGVGMLVHQAGRAYRLWTGTEPPIEVMHSAARDALLRAKT